MKVFVLPVNVASIGSITVEALNRIEGVEAKGFFINKHKYHYPSSNSYYFIGFSRLRRPLIWIFYRIKRFIIFRRKYRNADLVHWLYDDKGLTNDEIRFVKRHPKPCVVEWVGSDIRNPEYLSRINPHYAKAFISGYEYADYESAERSRLNQEKFFKRGAVPLVTPEMDLYLIKDLFPIRYFIEHKLFLKEFFPCYPSKNNKRPLIVHSPTAKNAKGSDHIINAIKDLKKDFDLDFLLLNNMSRAEVLEHVSKCDIFIDQVIIGMYGLASAEAMAFGKPVLCFILDEVYENGLSDKCPIVNASIANLSEKLRNLLENPEERHSLGVKSRKYAEEFFSAEANAKKQVDIYKKVVSDFNVL